VVLNRFIFTDWLTIEAEDGHTPVLSHFKITGAFEKIYLKGLTILKESYDGEGNYWEAEEINYNTSACVYFGSSDFWGRGKHVKLFDLTVKTAENTSQWTAADWVEKSASGISLRSVENVEIVNCTIENIRHGIAIEYASDNTTAVNNVIRNYSADGCRLISNNVFFAYNTITDCYDVDENHDDAIQSYSRGEDNSPGTGVLRNVIIRGNLIIGTTDFSNSLRGNPQGIGCFDGFFDNWIVENNVVITNHYHGISFYGMLDSKIVNNTVIDQVPDDDISPWIRITDHKEGTPSKNCVAANNIVSSSVSVSGNSVTEVSNYVIGKENYNTIYQLFADPGAFDMHLQVNETTQAHIIDKGEYYPGLVSSEMDRDNNPRISPPDLGAYEAY
jgi:parallel beta-helix repeat protein